MSSIDLFLLGFLEREQQSAYDLAKKVTQYSLDGLIRLSIPAIYKKLKNLEEQGFLVSFTKKRGEYPEKTIYTITAKGKAYFRQLMEKHSTERIRLQFTFNSVILNLDCFPQRKREKLVLSLKQQLTNSRAEQLKALKALQTKLPTTKILLEQIELVNNALQAWLDNLLKKGL